MRYGQTLRDAMTKLVRLTGSMRIVALVAAAVLMGQAASAFADPSAAGLWEQISEKTGKAQSTITISESGGVFVGRITSIFPAPGKPANPTCVNCSGSAKGQPMKGLQIIEGMKQSGLSYSDGTILDPESGTVYNATMQLSPDGAHLTVRGYVGISAFGRSQTWNRIR